MYAVVEIADIQFKVGPADVVNVPLLEAEIGDVIEFNKILVAGDDTKSEVGSPYIDGLIQAKVLGFGRDKRVLVFKKKRRKGHRKLNGHRQYFSVIGITKMAIPGFEITENDFEIEEVDDHIFDQEIENDIIDNTDEEKQ